MDPGVNKDPFTARESAILAKLHRRGRAHVQGVGTVQVTAWRSYNPCMPRQPIHFGTAEGGKLAKVDVYVRLWVELEPSTHCLVPSEIQL